MAEVLRQAEAKVEALQRCGGELEQAVGELQAQVEALSAEVGERFVLVQHQQRVYELVRQMERLRTAAASRRRGPPPGAPTPTLPGSSIPTVLACYNRVGLGRNGMGAVLTRIPDCLTGVSKRFLRLNNILRWGK